MQKQFNKIVNMQNNQGATEFEGYSPNEMELILYKPFSKNSPIQLNKLTESDYKSVSLLNLVKYLAILLSENGEIKLTKTESLPVKVVKDIYAKGFFKDKEIESGITKLSKETDSLSINLTKILIELSGLAKRQKGCLSLTKSGEKILRDDDETLKLIFRTFATKFNWAYYDAHEGEKVGQLGFGFTLTLLGKYGKSKRLDSFYSDKYFRAFPALLNSFSEPYYGTVEEKASYVYSIRTFDRFLNYFNFIEIEKNYPKSETHIRKTDLFDKFISVCRIGSCKLLNKDGSL